MSVEGRARAPLGRVWGLLASPACWPAWAPHMAHVERRTSEGEAVDAPGQVRTGDRLRISVSLLRLPLEVEIDEVDAPRSWSLRAATPLGTIGSTHQVQAEPDGITAVSVRLTFHGWPPLGRLVLSSYRPLAQFAVNRLLRLAAAEEDAAVEAQRRM